MRKKMRRRIDRRIFKKTAKQTRAANTPRKVMRGGIRL